MSYTTFPTTVPGPSYPLERQLAPRVKMAKLGDGYTQSAPDGLNYKLYTWSLTWENLTEAEKNTIEAFLEARNGYETFLWTDTDSVQFRVKAPSWTRTETAPKIFTIQVNFTQQPI